jgi:hypothetical protein
MAPVRSFSRYPQLERNPRTSHPKVALSLIKRGIKTEANFIPALPLPEFLVIGAP